MDRESYDIGYPFNCACERRDFEMAQFLWKLDRKACDIKYIFSCACKRGDLVCAEWLFSKDLDACDLELERCLSESCGKDLKVSNWLIEKGAKNLTNCFSVACAKGDVESAEMLLKKGAKCHGNYFSDACARNDLVFAQWLHDMYTDPGNKVNTRSITDIPFNYACDKGDYETAQWLIFLDPIDQNKIQERLDKLEYIDDHYIDSNKSD